MSKELVNDETTEICVTLFESLKYIRVIQQLRGPILTPNPPRVDKRGHFTYPPPFFPRGKKNTSPPLTSTCTSF